MNILTIKHALAACMGFGCLLASTWAEAEVFKVSNSPRTFTVVSPSSWVQQPSMTGNSRIKFSSPRGTPPAECAIIVQEYQGLRSKPQSVFDTMMSEKPDPAEIATHLSSIYNNVEVRSAVMTGVSGYPAHLANYHSSVGTPAGEQWMRGIFITTATTPGLIWIVTCGAMGRTLSEAERNFSYWQSEIVRFPTNIKIQQ